MIKIQIWKNGGETKKEWATFEDGYFARKYAFDMAKIYPQNYHFVVINPSGEVGYIERGRQLTPYTVEIKCIYTECPHPEDCKTECLLDGTEIMKEII